MGDPIRVGCRRFRLGVVSSAALISALVVGSPWFVPTVPAGASSSGSSLSPLTAGGCNGHVCIYIKSSTTWVTYWRTTALLPSSMCSVAKYWANGNLIYEGNTKCGSAGETVSSYWTYPGFFAAGTELCNTWTGVTGKACETVE